MSNIPLQELNDGTNVSLGGYQLRVEHIPMQERIEAMVANIFPPPVPMPTPPWYRRLWIFLNLDIRTIWAEYIHRT